MGWFSKLWPFGKKADPGKSPDRTEVPEGEPADDEDAMIETGRLHKSIKRLVMARLRAEGINCKATTGNDPNGDILIIRRKDIARVREIIWSLNSGGESPKAGRSQDGRRVKRRRS
jgi:hypothetical protein